jgi:hypothetical protein
LFLPLAINTKARISMKQKELEDLLLLEIQRIIAEVASGALGALGKPVNAAARSGYITEEDLSKLKSLTTAEQFAHPLKEKFAKAYSEKYAVLGYPIDGEISFRALETHK